MPARKETLGALAGEQEERVGSAEERRTQASLKGRLRGLGWPFSPGEKRQVLFRRHGDTSGWWEQGTRKKSSKGK